MSLGVGGSFISRKVSIVTFSRKRTCANLGFFVSHFPNETGWFFSTKLSSKQGEYLIYTKQSQAVHEGNAKQTNQKPKRGLVMSFWKQLAIVGDWIKTIVVLAL